MNDLPVLAVPPPASLPPQADNHMTMEAAIATLRATPPAVMTRREASIVATLSMRKLCELIESGRLKSIRLGRRVVIARSALEQTLGCKLS